MEPLQTHGAACEAVDNATAGASPSPGVSANVKGECEAMDSATAGASPSPGVSANVKGEFESVDSATSATIDASLFSEVYANIKEEFENVDSVTASASPSPEVPENIKEEFEAVDDPIFSTFLSPEVSENIKEEFEAIDNPIFDASPSLEISVDIKEECEAVDSATVDAYLATGVSANTLEDKRSSNSTSSPMEPPIFVLGEKMTRLELFNALVARSKLITRGRPMDLSNYVRLEILTSLLGDEYATALQAHKQQVLRILSSIIYKCESKYKASKRHMNAFKKKHNNWLNKKFLEDLKDVFTVEEHEYFLLYQQRRQQLQHRKRLQEIREEEPRTKIIKTFTETIMQQSSSTEHSPTAVAKSTEDINTCVETPSKAGELTKQIAEPQTFTPEEALGIIIDLNISVVSYNELRLSLQCRGYSAFPPYYKVLECKRNCCPDEPVTTTETEAYVPLQSLIDHTFKRIVKCCEPVIDLYCHQNCLTRVECDFVLSWGFDGSTGQSLYNQKITMSDSSVDETNLFATTLVPLRVSIGSQVIWANPSPTSYRFCRPIRIQYKKESRDLILSEKAYIESQINSLLPSTTATSKMNKVISQTHLTLSLIDGNVINVISNTNSQLKCPICKLAASDFNKLELAFSKPCDPSALQNGITPAHAWIRVLEFILNLGYKNDPLARVWRVCKNTPTAEIVEQRKKTITETIWQRLGLLVDVVKPNEGSTNDGNTARLALSDENRKLFGEILGLRQWLLDDLHTILVTISCGLSVDATKFGEFCKMVASKYVSEYNWHPMTVTIHKLLVHGKDLIKQSILPVGLLSEQAAETRKKILRCVQVDHEKAMSDLFHRALECSDPVISSIRLKKRQKYWKKIPLSDQVRSLLEAVDVSQDSEDEEDAGFLLDPTEDFVTDNYNDTIILSREVDILDSD